MRKSVGFVEILDKKSHRNTFPEPIEKTRVVEYSHRICFSKEPVMECPRRAQNGKTQEKKVCV